MKNLIKLSLLIIFSFTIINCVGDDKKEKVKISTKKESNTKKETVEKVNNSTKKKSETKKEKEVKEEKIEKVEKVEEKYDLSNKGIGPIKLVTLSADINQSLVVKGENIFKSKCTACHKIGKKFIGPAPNGIFEKRSPEWIMNKILNSDEMTQKDPVAKSLFIAYNGISMGSQNLTEEEARSVLEYFRTLK